MSYGRKSGGIIEKTAFHKGKSRNRTTMNLNKLLAKGHLIPIYNVLDESLCLVGYRRKPSSRKAHQRPFMLKQPLVIGPVETNPESP
jgi:hypothetical protein